MNVFSKNFRMLLPFQTWTSILHDNKSSFLDLCFWLYLNNN